MTRKFLFRSKGITKKSEAHIKAFLEHAVKQSARHEGTDGPFDLNASEVYRIFSGIGDCEVKNQQSINHTLYRMMLYYFQAPWNPQAMADMINDAYAIAIHAANTEYPELIYERYIEFAHRKPRSDEEASIVLAMAFILIPKKEALELKEVLKAHITEKCCKAMEHAIKACDSWEIIRSTHKKMLTIEVPDDTVTETRSDDRERPFEVTGGGATAMRQNRSEANKNTTATGKTCGKGISEIFTVFPPEVERCVQVPSRLLQERLQEVATLCTYASDWAVVEKVMEDNGMLKEIGKHALFIEALIAWEIVPEGKKLHGSVKEKYRRLEDTYYFTWGMEASKIKKQCERFADILCPEEVERRKIHNSTAI